mgnify:CR=1 FL=1
MGNINSCYKKTNNTEISVSQPELNNDSDPSNDYSISEIITSKDEINFNKRELNILDSIPIPIMIMNKNYNIIFNNKKFIKTFNNKIDRKLSTFLDNNIDSDIKRLKSNEIDILSKKVKIYKTAEKKIPINIKISVYNDDYLIVPQDITTQINIERQFSEQITDNHLLLHNILNKMFPPFILPYILRHDHEAKFSHKKLVIGIFDIKDYTQQSSEKNMFPSLQFLYHNVDLLCTIYNIKKIEIIGDQIVLAANLERSMDDNPTIKDEVDRMIDLMLDIIYKVKNYQLYLRCGISIGDAHSGIIGINQFRHHVFGDVINVAARMESIAHQSTVRISNKAFSYIKNKSKYEYNIESPIMIKGKGLMSTFTITKKNLKIKTKTSPARKIFNMNAFEYESDPEIKEEHSSPKLKIQSRRQLSRIDISKEEFKDSNLQHFETPPNNTRSIKLPNKTRLSNKYESSDEQNSVPNLTRESSEDGQNSVPNLTRELSEDEQNSFPNLIRELSEDEQNSFPNLIRESSKVDDNLNKSSTEKY